MGDGFKFITVDPNVALVLQLNNLELTDPLSYLYERVKFRKYYF